jgi:hypothetical protein
VRTDLKASSERSRWVNFRSAHLQALRGQGCVRGIAGDVSQEKRLCDPHHLLLPTAVHSSVIITTIFLFLFLQAHLAP